MRRIAALALLIYAVLPLQTAKAQESSHASSPAPAAGMKDPGIATLISVLVTGGGQMYAGETRRGAALLGIGLGSLIVGSALSTRVTCEPGGFGDNCTTNTTPLVVGAVVYLGTWIYGIADASSSVERQNARRQRASNRIRPSIGSYADGRTLLGLSIGF